MSDFWSTSDFVYMCLRDRRRTEAFGRAIDHAVRPGARVADIGSGSGVLALMAAAAGADEVFAVERDEQLAERLRSTVARNGMADRIVVIEEDVTAADLPTCDVVVTEMIETGLIDEKQVPVHNLLLAHGVIGEGTTVIPSAYETRCQLVEVTSTFYGFDVDVVRHDWPFYADSDRWAEVDYAARSETLSIWRGDFSAGPIVPEVAVSLDVALVGAPAVVDAVRLSGLVHMPGGEVLGPMPAMNGDKVIPIPAIGPATRVQLDVRYVMGEGMAGLDLSAAERRSP